MGVPGPPLLCDGLTSPGTRGCCSLRHVKGALHCLVRRLSDLIQLHELCLAACPSEAGIKKAFYWMN